jgi:hypothetical protein
MMKKAFDHKPGQMSRLFSAPFLALFPGCSIVLSIPCRATMMLKPILLIEDDKKIARVVTAYLEGEGYRVIHAERALQLIQRHAADLGVLGGCRCRDTGYAGKHHQPHHHCHQPFLHGTLLPFREWSLPIVQAAVRAAEVSEDSRRIIYQRVYHAYSNANASFACEC